MLGPPSPFVKAGGVLGSDRQYSLPGSRLLLPASQPETRQPGRGSARGAVERTLDRPPLLGGRLHPRCQVDPASCGGVGQTGALRSLQPGACAQNTGGSRACLRGHLGRSVPRHLLCPLTGSLEPQPLLRVP